MTPRPLLLALAALPLLLAGCSTDPVDDARDSATALAGDWYCETDGAEACFTESPIVLTAEGRWGFAGRAGSFTVEGAQVTFDGVGGPASWGAATLADDAMRFRTTAWGRPVDRAAELAGSYACSECVGREPIVLEPGSKWSWGASGGSFVAFPDGKLRFYGPSSGPPGWGLATLGDGSFTFRETTYVRSA